MLSLLVAAPPSWYLPARNPLSTHRPWRAAVEMRHLLLRPDDPEVLTLRDALMAKSVEVRVSPLATPPPPSLPPPSPPSPVPPPPSSMPPSLPSPQPPALNVAKIHSLTHSAPPPGAQAQLERFQYMNERGQGMWLSQAWEAHAKDAPPGGGAAFLDALTRTESIEAYFVPTIARRQGSPNNPYLNRAANRNINVVAQSAIGLMGPAAGAGSNWPLDPCGD